MIPAFAYLRVSGKAQIDGDGFPRQREAITSFAASAGIEIIQEFVEKAVPGKTEWADRPAWTDMMLELNGCTTIVIESLNRLARDLMVQEHIIADLKHRGITLISVAEPDLCTDDPSRKLLRQIMGAIAEYDRAMIVLKLRGARRRMKASTGRCEGRKPFGHKPGEERTLDMIRLMGRHGMINEEIAKRLNDGGYATRSGKQWAGPTIAKILRRE